MDNEAGLESASEHLRDDLIERNDGGFNFGCKELESEIGGRQRSWNSDPNLADFVEIVLARSDNHRAVSLPNRSAAGHERIVVLQVRVGVEGDGGDVVKGFAYGAL